MKALYVKTYVHYHNISLNSSYNKKCLRKKIKL